MGLESKWSYNSWSKLQDWDFNFYQAEQHMISLTCRGYQVTASKIIFTSFRMSSNWPGKGYKTVHYLYIYKASYFITVTCFCSFVHSFVCMKPQPPFPEQNEKQKKNYSKIRPDVSKKRRPYSQNNGRKGPWNSSLLRIQYEWIIHVDSQVLWAKSGILSKF